MAEEVPSIPWEQVEAQLRASQETLEDEEDVRVAVEARREIGRLSHADVMAELGRLQTEHD